MVDKSITATPSPLQALREKNTPRLPRVLQNLKSLIIDKQNSNGSGKTAKLFPKTSGQPILRFSPGNKERVGDAPLRVGVVFSGGPAPGGHNVIIGLFNALKTLNSQSRLFGYLDGPSGIIKNSYKELEEKALAKYNNQGGFDLIGSGRTKIETPEQFQGAANSVKELKLDGLLIIGGDDSNTNAALLSEYFLENGISTSVVGVPKTIDGDLKNNYIETSFGFDTATKTYSNAIGSILTDCLSQKKYYFFIKLMGRSASHIALECALQTHPNLTLIGEEIASKKQTLQDVTHQICDLICLRAAKKKNYGAILVPEGIVEFIPEMKLLLKELNASTPVEKLSREAANCFHSLPKRIQDQLFLDRDPHGNVRVSQIETERLLIETVQTELENRTKAGTYSLQFTPQPLFFGYEGRCTLPSNFDCNYCYSLGCTAAMLINAKATGYICCIQNLAKPVEEWTAAGVPLAEMIHLEERGGKSKPVIEKALVDLQGKPFFEFQQNRESWKVEDDYLNPGPIQYYGPPEISENTTIILKFEANARFFLS